MTSRKNIGKYILNSSTLNERLNHNFFNNIQVYVKEPLPEKFNLSYVLRKVENLIPKQFVYNIDSIIIGQFDEFLEKKVNASYKNGVLYITNNQDDASDMVDDIIHEIAHAVEEMAHDEIYDDDGVKNEFLGKRERLYNICKKENMDVNLDDFLNVNFSQNYDDLLYKTIGYPLLVNLSMGLFLSPYSITSVREYFAIGFEHYYLKDRNYLRTISPKVYQKINYLETLSTRGDS